MNTNTDRKHKSAGNTIRSRCWILTIFNINEVKHDPKAIYECWCNDTCKDGRPHMHQVYYFSNAVSFKRIQAIYGNAHIETAKNVHDAIHYILDNKNGRKTNIQELGDKPHDTRFKTIKELSLVNDDEVPPYLYSAYSKYKNKPKAIKLNDWNKNVKVIYISGPSGIGKSNKAFEIMSKNNVESFDEISYENGFYIGISDDCKVCVFDDFRDSRMKPDEFIRFIDYRKHTMNIKGGQVLNNYELIIITSIKRIDELYKNVKDEQREQWIRRMEVIDLTPIDEDIYL